MELTEPDRHDSPSADDLRRLWREWWDVEPVDPTAPLVEQLRDVDARASVFGSQNHLLPPGRIDGPYEAVITENQGVWSLGRPLGDPTRDIGVFYGSDPTAASDAYPIAGLLYRACAVEAVFSNPCHMARGQPSGDAISALRPLRQANCIGNRVDWNLPAVWRQHDVLMIGFDDESPRWVVSRDPDASLGLAGSVLELSAFD